MSVSERERVCVCVRVCLREIERERRVSGIIVIYFLTIIYVCYLGVRGKEMQSLFSVCLSLSLSHTYTHTLSRFIFPLLSTHYYCKRDTELGQD